MDCGGLVTVEGLELWRAWNFGGLVTVDLIALSIMWGFIPILSVPKDQTYLKVLKIKL